MRLMQDIDLNQQRVLIREDLNVPLENGEITSDQRIRAALPTIEMALKQNAKVILMSHLGRPIEGDFSEKYSLKPVAKRLSEYLKQEVLLIKNWMADDLNIKPEQCVLLENIRFNRGEKANDVTLAKKLASLCDIFVMDAFATAHRAEASTVGVTQFAKIACAGPLLAKELAALKQALENPKRPLLAIVGGAKVSTKLTVLSALIEKVNGLIIGGGIANTFIAAAGFHVGKSLYEPDLLTAAKNILKSAQQKKIDLPLPLDVVTAKAFAKDASATVKTLAEIEASDMILDIGPKTASIYTDKIKQAATILWNGPVGVFEWPAFANGTLAVAKAIASSSAFSIAGGGDTLAAVDQFQIEKDISYISTGGGAFLEFVEGKKLPAVTALEEKA